MATVPLGDVIGKGVEADRPAAGIAGRLYYTEDGSPEGWYRDDGTDWISAEPSGGSFTSPMTTDGDLITQVSGSPAAVAKGSNNMVFGVLPDGTLGYKYAGGTGGHHIENVPTTGWTSVNGSGTANDEGAAYASMGYHNGEVLHARVRAATASATRQYWGLIIPGWLPEKDVEVGICLNDSGSGKFISFTIGYDSAAPGPCARVRTWDDFSTLNTELAKVPIFPGAAFLMIQETSGARNFFLNYDNRVNFITIFEDSGLNHITARADRAGYCWNPNAASGSANVCFALGHWHAD